MPKGIPNKKLELANGEQISKMEAMRRALAKIGRDARPLEYQTFIKSKFGIEMTADMVSNYKSSLLKASAEANAVTPPTPKGQAKPAGEFSLHELEAVKALADKIGAEKVRQLAQALAK
jgi:hypothetical protein